MVARFVALIRGINVGGKNVVPMSELRALMESLGHRDVETLIQSGNVLFTANGKAAPKGLESAVAGRFGVDVTVILRTLGQLRDVVEGNPYAGRDPSKLHVGFMARPLAAGVQAGLDVERFRPEEATIRAHELYFHLPNGMGRSKLPPYLERRLKVPITIRNWNTVTKLLGLAER